MPSKPATVKQGVILIIETGRAHSVFQESKEVSVTLLPEPIWCNKNHQHCPPLTADCFRGEKKHRLRWTNTTKSLEHTSLWLDDPGLETNLLSLLSNLEARMYTPGNYHLWQWFWKTTASCYWLRKWACHLSRPEICMAGLEPEVLPKNLAYFPLRLLVSPWLLMFATTVSLSDWIQIRWPCSLEIQHWRSNQIV